MGLVLFVAVRSVFTAETAHGAIVHQGKVTSVGANHISVLDNIGDNESFEVADDCKIVHNGKPADLSNIDEGDVAKLTLKRIAGKLVVVVIDARDSA